MNKITGNPFRGLDLDHVDHFTKKWSVTYKAGRIAQLCYNRGHIDICMKIIHKYGTQYLSNNNTPNPNET